MVEGLDVDPQLESGHLDAGGHLQGQIEALTLPRTDPGMTGPTVEQLDPLVSGRTKIYFCPGDRPRSVVADRELSSVDGVSVRPERGRAAGRMGHEARIESWLGLRPLFDAQRQGLELGGRSLVGVQDEGDGIDPRLASRWEGDGQPRLYGLSRRDPAEGNGAVVPEAMPAVQSEEGLMERALPLMGDR